jgi:hypothetical protein
MFVDAVFPPATRDHVDVLSVTGPALSLNAIEDVLPILQLLHSALEL